mmetsp:Transcript_39935/g.83524  ORF Transcript_39935/g.83524 Transcript_39935/m.83524 type:complete len:309 (+) Transcript_39935:1116-2042(+)
MKKSFYFGMGCSLLSFGMLRWRRARGGLFSGMSRYASQSSTSSSRPTGAGGYTFDALPPKPGNGGQFHHSPQYAHGSSTNSRSGFVIDMTLSTLLGLGTSLLAIENDLFYPTANAHDRNQNQQQSLPSYAIEPPPQWISPSIPLVPGRSVIADTLCRPLTEEFRKFPKRLWRNGNHRKGIEGGCDDHHMALYANSGWRGTKYYEGNDNASVVNSGETADGTTGNAANRQGAGVYERLVLDNLQGFVINCERRARQERTLRKIQGMREGAPVVIPEAGVSADEDLDLSDIYYERECEDDRGEDDAGFGL